MNSDNEILIVGSTQNSEFGFECINNDIDYQGQQDICIIKVSNDSSTILTTQVLGGILYTSPKILP